MAPMCTQLPPNPSVLVLVLSAWLLVCSAICVSAQDDGPLLIDCGNLNASGDDYSSDIYFDSGDPFTVAANGSTFEGVAHRLTTVERTGRVFPEDTGGCYKIPRAPGTYSVRTGFAYFNFDQKNNTPIFNVTLQGVPVATINFFAFDVMDSGNTSDATYRDFLAYTDTGYLEVCVVPFKSDHVPGMDLRSDFDLPAYPMPGQSRTAFINSLGILPAPPSLYSGALISPGVMLSTVLRLNLGGQQYGPDSAGRTWDAVPPGDDLGVTPNAPGAVQGAGSSPDYLPADIFQSFGYATDPGNTSMAQMGVGRSVVPMDKSHRFLVRLYFAEMNAQVKRGDRVFNFTIFWGNDDIMMGVVSPNFDILAAGDPLTIVQATHVLSFSDSPSYHQFFGIVLESDASKPPAVLSAVEVYEVVRPQGVAGLAPDSAPWLSNSVEQAQVMDGEMSQEDKTRSRGPTIIAATIAAIVLGVLLLLVLMAGGAFIYMRRNSNPTPFQQFEGGSGNTDGSSLVNR